MQSHNYWKEDRWNATDSIYTFETKSKIEFFSTDNAQKLRGGRRDRLFINEANNVPYDAFDQLEFRTNEFIYLDWNPSEEFWYYTEIKGKRDDVEELTVTYLDNEAIDPRIKATIEQRRNNKMWWQVYALGQLGEVQTRIYTGWQIIPSIPHEARLLARWLDFGYTNDPSSIGEIYEYNGGYIAHELLYQKGQTNKQLADFLLSIEHPQTLIIADSAEPKSIDELKSYGLNIVGVSKRPGESKSETFVRWSIGTVQSVPMSVTESSLSTIKEYRNYMWMVDKDGKILNIENPACANHSMAGIRYVISTYSRRDDDTKGENSEREVIRRRVVMSQSR